MSRTRLLTALVTLTIVALPGAIGWKALQPATAEATADAQATKEARIKLGEYIVRTSGCHDCHTPWKLGPKGPEPDMTRALSGHPQDLVMPPAPKLPDGPWNWIGAASNTAFAGPWGVSFSMNLTPDRDTGIGSWTEEMFIQALRTGRQQGKGRPILPPMPFSVYGQKTDEDLKSVFAYLQSLPPMKNKVPQPIDPPEAGK